MKQKQILVVSAVLLIVVVIAGVFFFRGQSSAPSREVTAQNQAALMRIGAPTYGNTKAAVHIVEFLDPACGTCRDFYPMVKGLVDANTDKVFVSVRYAPFHPGSDQVVKVLEAAKLQGQFEPALQALFDSQGLWVQNHVADVNLIWQPLGKLGLDMNRLKTDMNSPAVAQTIAQDVAAANTLGVSQTPEYFVNGKPLPSWGFDQLKSLVDDAVANSR